MDTSILVDILFIISLMVFLTTLYIIVPTTLQKRKTMVKSRVLRNDVESTMKKRK